MAARKPINDAPPLPERAQWKAYVDAQIAQNPHFIPPPQVCMEDVLEWQQQKEDLDRLKFAEVSLRKRISSFFFQAPEEGTNKVRLPNGLILNLQHSIKREVDKTNLETMGKLRISDVGRDFLTRIGAAHEHHPDDALVVNVLMLDLNSVIEWKPSLKVTEWRKLTDAQHGFFDTFMTVSESETPQVKIEFPKEK